MFFDNRKKKFEKFFDIDQGELVFEKNGFRINVPTQNFIEIIRENEKSMLSVCFLIQTYLYDKFLEMPKNKIEKLRQKFIDSGDIDIINTAAHYYNAADIAVAELSSVYADLFVQKYPLLSQFKTYSLCQYFDKKIKNINDIHKDEFERKFFLETRLLRLECIYEDIEKFLFITDLINSKTIREGFFNSFNTKEYNPQLVYKDNFDNFICWKSVIEYLKVNPVLIENEDKTLFSGEYLIGDFLEKAPSHSFELTISPEEHVTCFLTFKNIDKKKGIPVFYLNLVNYTNEPIENNKILSFISKMKV